MRARKQLFSIRMGYRKEDPPQVEDLNKRTRIAFRMLFIETMPAQNSDGYTLWSDFFQVFLSREKDKIFRPDKSELFPALRELPEIFFKVKKWYRVFDAIEWLEEVSFVEIYDEDEYYGSRDFIDRHNHEIEIDRKNFHKKVESILEMYSVGYAFIEGKFIPVSNSAETDAVQKAAASPLEKVKGHIGKAIDSLDRNNPDYANCIKESISAVEGILSEITGESEFSKAFAWLQKQKAPLHPQFIQAIKNLYTFTCDEGGIRHAIKDKKQQDIDQDAAVCMLVTCSAIANYLAAKMPQLKKDESGKTADDDNIPF